MKDFLRREGEVGKYVVKKVVSLMILWLIKKGPRSGYEIIKVFERQGMCHVATASRVYPLLKMLERMKFVEKKARMQGRRKTWVYSITREGRGRMEYASKWLSSSVLGEFFREMSSHGTRNKA